MTYIPIRQCVACRKKGAKSEFIRFSARGGEGRGAYICPNAACIKKAKKANALGRALRVHIGEETYDELLREAEK
ncbi:MAG: DUF448 domain-containing protein [Oscillospiraceae bacterium]|nr:DUF448 domain-containing protein [Oscillospiraceae bacterium]MBR1842717.1 DUF448 domain-containing protein [Oscillospiraceae bacterium]